MKLLTKRSQKMTFNHYLKKATICAVTASIALTSLSSIAADYSKAEKELKIMGKIFETSLSEANKSQSNRFGRSGRTESTYLAKQGMVFKFNFSQSGFSGAEDWRAFGEGVGQLVGSISAEIAQSFSEVDHVAPVAPIVPLADGNWEDNMEAFEAYNEAMENMREDQRDKREEVRDLQRSIRDIERQTRRENTNSAKLKDAKEKLKMKMKELENKMAVYKQSMEDYRKKRSEKYQLNNKKKVDLITSTLCDYGSTLRSLDSDEYVTLIFENYEGKKDQVHVFKYKNVKSCNNKESLLKKAISYQL